jgi:hypothetical protein
MRAPTPDELALRALADGHLTVDPETGAIYRGGRRAESPSPKAYGVVSVGHTTIGAHRLVWLALHGPIPGDLLVNHINKRPWDNRPSNLELVTRAGNWYHGHGEDYVSIGGNGVDPAWLAKVRDLLDSGDVDADALAELRGVPLSGEIDPYAGGSVVPTRSPVRAKRRNW